MTSLRTLFFHSTVVALTTFSIIPLEAAAKWSGGDVCERRLDKPAAVGKDIKHVLERVVGRISIAEQQGRIEASARLNHDDVANKKLGLGDELLKILAPHVDPNSPTAVRVEEKMVVTRADFDRFLQLSASGQNLKWELRDTPAPGTRNVTFTEYGDDLVLTQNTGMFGIKPRFRKYYGHAAGAEDQQEAYAASMGNLVALELKMAGQESSDPASILNVPGSVFKPRVFITDEIADQMKALDCNDDSCQDKFEELKAAARAIVDPKKNTPLNRADQVDSLFDAIKLLVKKDPQFLKPRYVTMYERESHKTKSPSGKEFQFTGDNRVSVFRAVPGIATKDMHGYMALAPLFKSPQGVVFAEIKSPPDEKREKTTLYTALKNMLFKMHVNDYEMDSGKFGLARRAELVTGSKNLDRTLLDNGALFWLIKGTANLPEIPVEKDILQKGQIEISFPVLLQSGTVVQVMFEYQPAVPDAEGRRSYALKEVFIINSAGDKIKIEGIRKEVVEKIRPRNADGVVGIAVENQVIPVKVNLSPREVADYRGFFAAFFGGKDNFVIRGRSIEDLYKIDAKWKLTMRRYMYSMGNFASWWVDRGYRGISGIAFAAGGAMLAMHLNAAQPVKYTVSTPTTQVVQTVDSGNVVKVDGLSDALKKAVTLSAQAAHDGGFVFEIPQADQDRFKDLKTIQLTASDQKVYTFHVQKLSDGKVILMLNPSR